MYNKYELLKKIELANYKIISNENEICNIDSLKKHYKNGINGGFVLVGVVGSLIVIPLGIGDTLTLSQTFMSLAALAGVNLATYYVINNKYKIECEELDYQKANCEDNIVIYEKKLNKYREILNEMNNEIVLNEENNIANNNSINKSLKLTRKRTF